jgi:hypothetical protein
MVFSHPVQVIPSIVSSTVAVGAGTSTAFWLLPPPQDANRSINDRRIQTVDFDLVMVFMVRLAECLISPHKYIKYYTNLKIDTNIISGPATTQGSWIRTGTVFSQSSSKLHNSHNNFPFD